MPKRSCKFDLGISYAADPVEWKRRYRRLWIRERRRDADYRAVELARQSAANREERAKRAKRRVKHVEKPPAPRPRCYFCRESKKRKGVRLQVVERMIPLPGGLFFAPARVLWCGKC